MTYTQAVNTAFVRAYQHPGVLRYWVTRPVLGLRGAYWSRLLRGAGLIPMLGGL